MGGSEGWGREQGRATAEKLVSMLSAHGGDRLVKISMEGVERIDASFASEAIAEVIARYRKTIGICLTDLVEFGVKLNIDLAAERVSVPVLVSNDGAIEVIGMKPSQGNREALEYAWAKGQVRAAEFAEVAGVSIANASTKYKQLWEQGFLMRIESTADTGGVEFLYRRIG
jgi:hypothetical protein